MNEYQKECLKTLRPIEDDKTANMYFGLKAAEEVGEICSLIAKHYIHGKKLDFDDLENEIGDLLYYVAVLANRNCFSLDSVAKKNIDKLRKRHGDEYNNKHYTG